MRDISTLPKYSEKGISSTWHSAKVESVRIFYKNSVQPRLLCHPAAQPAFDAFWGLFAYSEIPMICMLPKPVRCVVLDSKYLFIADFTLARNAIQMSYIDPKHKGNVLCISANNSEIEINSWLYMIETSLLTALTTNKIEIGLIYRTLENKMPKTVQKNVFGKALTTPIFSEFTGITVRRIEYQRTQYSLDNSSALPKFETLAKTVREQL